MTQQVMFSQELSMVGGNYHKSIFKDSLLFEYLENLPDNIVNL